MTNFKTKIAVTITASLIIVMTLSDWYYSGLEEEFPVLENRMAIQGVITGYKVHWKHSYVSIGQALKVNIPPPTATTYQSHEFYRFIQVGDSLYKEASSDKITVVKHGKKYFFRNVVQ